LDTTYLNPKYSFPPQPLVIDACAELARRLVNGESLASGDGSDGAPGPAGLMDGWINHVKKEETAEPSKKEKILIVVG
jgi:DNA cross-link repair 1A protein